MKVNQGDLYEFYKSGGTHIREFNTYEKTYEGSTLLFDDWKICQIKLKVNENYIEEPVVLNYNLVDNILYIKKDDRLFEMQLAYLDEFQVESIINTTIYQIKENHGTQIFKEESIGKFSLLSNIKVEVRKPTYNSALDVGNKNHKVKRSTDLYVAYNDALYEIPKKKKALKKSKLPIEIIEYLNESNVDIQNIYDMKEAFDVINSNNK